MARSEKPTVVDQAPRADVATLNTKRQEVARAATAQQLPWHKRTFCYALASAALLYLSSPPADLWPLAWFAPIGWLLLIRKDELPGRRPYLAIWAAGFLFWFGVYWWLCLPHWATSIGWVAVAFYHAFYIPAFVGLSRTAVHGLRLPLILAAPVVWTGLELVRGYLLTGITMGALGHTQYRWLEVIQISDLVGAYGVGFVVMFVAASLARMVPCDGSRWSTKPLVPLVIVFGAVLAYGFVRIGAPGRPAVEIPAGSKTHAEREPAIHVGLIQGSMDTQFNSPEDTPKRVWEHYMRLTKTAMQEHPEIDLLVWPETTLRYPLIIVDDDAAVPDDYPEPAETFRREARAKAAESLQGVCEIAKYFKTSMILGIDIFHFRADGFRSYNAALHVDSSGRLLGRYDKLHRVLFGEYVPFTDWFPWLQRLTPLPFSINAGEQPTVFEHRGVRISPSICYENVLPQVIRRQLTDPAVGATPDMLVNLTNDGWFWGSSELKLHLACGVFRAVEFRKPSLIAANTGISAFIDGDGRILKQGPRRDTDIIMAEVQPDGRGSLYLRYGDWLAGLCLLATGLFAAVGGWSWLRFRLARPRNNL